FSPISGWLGERYGARRLMLAGGLLYGGSMGLLGLVRQPWHFLLAFSVLLSLTQSIFLVPLIAPVTASFPHPLGLATLGLSPAGAPGRSRGGGAGVGGPLLGPGGGGWRPDPVADAPLPRPPRRLGPHALWGDGRGPARGGPEPDARAPAAPGVHAPRAGYPGLLGSGTWPRRGLRGPRDCGGVCCGLGGRPTATAGG